MVIVMVLSRGKNPVTSHQMSQYVRLLVGRGRIIYAWCWSACFYSRTCSALAIFPWPGRLIHTVNREISHPPHTPIITRPRRSSLFRSCLQTFSALFTCTCYQSNATWTPGSITCPVTWFFSVRFKLWYRSSASCELQSDLVMSLTLGKFWTVGQQVLRCSLVLSGDFSFSKGEPVHSIHVGSYIFA